MRFKHLLFTGLLSLVVLVSFAAESPCKIEIQAPQWKNDTIFLCNYFNGTLYKKDSIQLSSKGLGAFVSQEALPEGLYVIYCDAHQYFDLLLANDQTFKLTVDTLDFIRKNTIIGSVQSEAFVGYTRYLVNKQKQQSDLSEKMNKLPEDQRSGVLQQLSVLNNEVQQYMKDFSQKYQNQWVELFFRGVQSVEGGPFPSPRSQEEYQLQMEYLKTHFFDTINLSDVRFWRTGYFPKKIDGYMDQIVEKDLDSLANAASRLVERSKSDTLCFRLMLSHLFNYSVQSPIMGMENIWAKLAEDYYLKGLTPWVDSAFYANVESEYKKIHFNRISMQAHNLLLYDAENSPVSMDSITSEYTLLYFFEPGCGHCKKMTPVVHDQLYKKYKTSGLEVLCVYTQTDKNEWLKFIEEHHLDDWKNVWDPQRKSFFWYYYDVSVTPAVYLLDKDKKIIAKKLDEESLEKVLENLTKK